MFLLLKFFYTTYRNDISDIYKIHHKISYQIPNLSKSNINGLGMTGVKHNLTVKQLDGQTKVIELMIRL